MQQQSNIVALDVGEKRIGVALAHSVALLPSPHGVIINDDTVWFNIQKLINDNDVSRIVVGLPQGLDHQVTGQTNYTQAFVDELKNHTNVAIVTEGEAGTSKLAEEELLARKKPYSKGDIDALAATYILRDYLSKGEWPK